MVLSNTSRNKDTTFGTLFCPHTIPEALMADAGGPINL